MTQTMVKMKEINNLVSSVKRVYQEQGTPGVFFRTLEVILDHTFNIPQRKFVIKNKVAVKEGRLLSRKNYYPSIEQELIKSIRQYVNVGDDVIVIGGGSGVSTVWNARQVGNSGSVLSFEPGKHSFEVVKETIDANGISHIADAERAAIGLKVNVRGSASGCKDISPNALPDCNVLEMDCDGAEVDILRNLTIEPRLIIVETHGALGTPEHKVKQTLNRKGYEVIDKKLHSEENGIVILTAELNNDRGNSNDL